MSTEAENLRTCCQQGFRSQLFLEDIFARSLDVCVCAETAYTVRTVGIEILGNKKG